MNTKILVLDDDSEVRSLLVDILKTRENTWVLQMGNSTATIDVLRFNDFDYLVTDVAMPQLNGIELIREVKKISPKTRIICLTGYADVISSEPELTEGVLVVQKPIKAEKLLDLFK